MTKHKNPHPDSKHAKTQDPLSSDTPAQSTAHKVALDAIHSGKHVEFVHLDGTRERIDPKTLYRDFHNHSILATPKEMHPAADPVRHTVSRWVYHVSGHAKLHAPRGPKPGADSKDQSQAVPFEVVVRHDRAITRDEDMEAVRQATRGHIVTELDKLGSPYIVGDVMVRSVCFLHHILVDHDDIEGEPAKVTI